MTKLTLELPDELVERLADEARQHGRNVEEETRDSLAARFSSSAKPQESREEILERIRARRENMPPVTASPEELQEWINYGRPSRSYRVVIDTMVIAYAVFNVQPFRPDVDEVLARAVEVSELRSLGAAELQFRRAGTRRSFGARSCL